MDVVKTRERGEHEMECSAPGGGGVPGSSLQESVQCGNLSSHPITENCARVSLSSSTVGSLTYCLPIFRSLGPKLISRSSAVSLPPAASATSCFTLLTLSDPSCKTVILYFGPSPTFEDTLWPNTSFTVICFVAVTILLEMQGGG